MTASATEAFFQLCPEIFKLTAIGYSRSSLLEYKKKHKLHPVVYDLDYVKGVNLMLLSCNIFF